jgi:hypothetical protein
MTAQKKIPLQPLRERVKRQLGPLTEPPQMALLRDYALSTLAGESASFDTIQQHLSAIQRRPDELGDEFVGVIAADLNTILEGLARQALSEGAPAYPELQVKLNLAKAPGGKPASNSKPAPGSRTRLGGRPLWIGADATPICKSCKGLMTFVAQIDSIANQDTDLGRFLQAKSSFMFADAGMIYVFWCPGCCETASVLQSY